MFASVSNEANVSNLVAVVSTEPNENRWVQCRQKGYPVEG